MSDTSELDRLILTNLLDLDDSAKRIDALTETIWDEITQEVEEWGKKRPWQVVEHRDDLRLGPIAWGIKSDAEAWFYLDFGPGDRDSGGDGERYFYLSRYVGVGGGKLCLWFNQKVAPPKDWKIIANGCASEMAELGFSLSDGGNFYTDCTLNADLVAAALSGGEFDAAMAPIRAALARAAAAADTFSKLLAAAKLA